MGVYKCPVCEGRGFVNNGFYQTLQDYYTSGSTSTETCRTCNGKGIVFDAELFSGSCYGHAGPAVINQGDPGYAPITFVAKGTCSNCEYNDRMVYTSNPPKWKCTLNNEWHEGGYRCEHWCDQQQHLLQGTVVDDISKYITLTGLNSTGTEDTTIEGLTKSNSID